MSAVPPKAEFDGANRHVRSVPFFDHMAPPQNLFAPSQFGHYDMVGNVFEWVQDCYPLYYEGALADGYCRAAAINFRCVSCQCEIFWMRIFFGDLR
jgi:formylglycine-generating enzyme required for sulfatase activity